MEIGPQSIAWSDCVVRSLPEEATFEMRAKQQAGASWTEIRVEGARQRGQQVQRPAGGNWLGLLDL